MIRKAFFLGSTLCIASIFAAATFWPPVWWLMVVVGPLMALGLRDALQHRHALLRNYPVIGHGRYLLEAFRPEISQYFIEQNQDGRPMNREQRSLVYQRAKGQRDTLPFGTQLQVERVGYEWINHTIVPAPVPDELPRVRIGGTECRHPYNAAVLNVSAMSFGSLSKRAILALNEGAKRGGFYHNTGEGGVSDYHLAPGGDLVWQIGTGYFGCRAQDGGFDEGLFRDSAQRDAIKMIEVKLSQGAKPGHGGILPAAKITFEIARIRNVPMGADVLSPPSHRTFSTPPELLEWIQHLRELSGGKPVGFKLCLGKRHEFMALLKAMRKTGIRPDFIAIDGGEGGTGAAPLEFSNRVGSPIAEALVFAHNALVGMNLREDIRVIASGKVVSGFDIVKMCALGADVTNSARAMMFALGCIQALRCNDNTCPTGVATQSAALERGLVVPDKATRVYRYQHDTVEAMVEVICAAGLTHPDQLRPWHIKRRVDDFEIKHYGEIYPFVEPGALLERTVPTPYQRPLLASRAETFEYST